MLCGKEWADFYRNKRMLALTFVLPLVLLVIPLLGLWAGRVAPEGELAAQSPPPLARLPGWENLGPRDRFQAVFATQFLTLFLLTPLTVPVSVAAYSVVGEKRERSLEPLLATPLRTGELIAGKALGAVLPALAATVIAYGVYAGVARALVRSDAVYALVLGPLPLLLLLVIAPLLALLGVLLALVVSSRSSDPRAAEQVSLTLVLPLIALFVLQVFGAFQLTAPLLLTVAGVLCALDLLALRLAVRAFARGSILGRL